MKTKLFVILALALFSVGCQQGHSGAHPQSLTQSEVSKPQRKREILPNGVVIEIYKVIELRNDRSNYSAFKQNLNMYEVKITIPEHVFTSDLEISRTLSASSLNPFYEIVSKSDAVLTDDNKYIVYDRLSFRESDLTPKTVTYKVYTNDILNGESTATLIPDLIIESSAEATTLQSLGVSSGQYEFGVIVFEKNSVLRTEGAVVFFKTQRVFAENAVVESFSQEFALSAAAIGEAGKNGGRFGLQTEYAWGDLEIYMRGTAGGQGFPAKQQTAVGATGAKGADGSYEKSRCESVNPKYLSIKPDVFSGVANPDVIVCDWICHDPGNGADGEQGPAGFSGGVGMLGGTSGSAEITVNQKLGQFDVKILSTPGAGGPGGDGGQGGRGGAGGLPGDIAKGCNKGASAGREGAQGSAGSQGPQGEDGYLEQSTVIIDGQKII